jgi:hypothetical protein
VARDEPHACTIPASHDAKAVMLDLVQPFRPGWRPLSAGRQAGGDMADRAGGTRNMQHAGLIESEIQRVSLRNNSGSLAIFTGIRCASSLLSNQSLRPAYPLV